MKSLITNKTDHVKPNNEQCRSSAERQVRTMSCAGTRSLSAYHCIACALAAGAMAHTSPCMHPWRLPLHAADPHACPAGARASDGLVVYYVLYALVSCMHRPAGRRRDGGCHANRPAHGCWSGQGNDGRRARQNNLPLERSSLTPRCTVCAHVFRPGLVSLHFA
jgi:hypothetical protein